MVEACRRKKLHHVRLESLDRLQGRHQYFDHYIYVANFTSGKCVQLLIMIVPNLDINWTCGPSSAVPRPANPMPVCLPRTFNPQLTIFNIDSKPHSSTHRHFPNYLTAQALPHRHVYPSQRRLLRTLRPPRRGRVPTRRANHVRRKRG